MADSGIMTESGPVISGGTQALVQAQDVPHYDTGVMAYTALGNTPIIVTHNLGVPIEQLDIVVLMRRIDNNWQRIDSLQMFDGSLKFGFTIAQNNTNSISINIASGGLICLNIDLNWTNNINAIRVLVYKKQMLAPIIAGQGALVSGGAFQFDADGQGYTENYFETEVQVGWYTRADGKKKPVYSRMYISTTQSAAANTYYDETLAWGVETILNAAGAWQTSTNYWTPFGEIDNPTATASGTQIIGTWSMVFLEISTGAITLKFIHRAARTNMAAKVKVTFTKLSDAWI
jgi:hypothetical protein